jgi:hypothetical protein
MCSDHNIRQNKQSLIGLHSVNSFLNLVLALPLLSNSVIIPQDDIDSLLGNRIHSDLIMRSEWLRDLTYCQFLAQRISCTRRILTTLASTTLRFFTPYTLSDPSTTLPIAAVPAG